jgi:hypothetical protein
MTTKRCAIARAALGALACSDPAGPPAGTTPITLNLCAAGGPLAWVAYQNEGGAWTQLSPGFSGSVSFNATEKVSIAIGLNFFGASFTQVVNATAAELSAEASVPCSTAFATRTMNGTVSGLASDQLVRISASTSSDNADAFDPSWAMEDLPSTAVDILATRYSGFGSQPDRVLVRRSIVPPNGTVAALNFASAEAAAIETATVTLNGIPAGASAGVATSVMTPNGTLHELGDASATASSPSAPYASLPASLRIAADQHVMTATAVDADGDRSATFYYRTPAAKTLTFGPLVSAPTLTNASTTPYVRPRAQIASQAEYPGAVLAQWTETSQAQSTTRLVAVMTTAGFLGGTPATWTVEFPDMTSAHFDPSWGLQTTSYEWGITAFSTTATPTELLGPAREVDGTTVLSSSRSSGSSLFLPPFFRAATRLAAHRSTTVRAPR